MLDVELCREAREVIQAAVILALRGSFALTIQIAVGMRGWKEAALYAVAAREANREYGGLLALEWRDEGQTLVITGPVAPATPLEPLVREEFDTEATLSGR